MRSFRKKSKEEHNLLDMVPMMKDGLTTKTEDGRTTVLVSRQSWLERQAVRFLKQPAVIKVAVDDLGAAVITRCDGTYTVADIATALKEEFGDAAEPLVPRLTKFIEIMEANGWLEWAANAEQATLSKQAESR